MSVTVKGRSVRYPLCPDASKSGSRFLIPHSHLFCCRRTSSCISSRCILFNLNSSELWGHRQPNLHSNPRTFFSIICSLYRVSSPKLQPEIGIIPTIIHLETVLWTVGYLKKLCLFGTSPSGRRAMLYHRSDGNSKLRSIFSYSVTSPSD